MSGIASGGISSTILYKFRSSTNYETLPMPGSMARLFDIKRAIVKAKKLDKAAGGGLEFDLRITNASTEEVYSDDSLLLPRGTRVIVQRLPAARGTGLLARIAREEAGVQTRPSHTLPGANPPLDSSKFYTITSTENEQDEFIRDAINTPHPLDNSNTHDDEEDELRALRAVTEPTQGAAKTGAILGYNNRFGAANAGATAGTGGQHASNWMKNSSQNMFRQNVRSQADPELRELEQKQMTKKRATGIPRTFLNFVDKSSKVDGESGIDGPADGVEGEQQQESTIKLQPNQLGFQQLLRRAGGRSSGTNPQVVLQNALTITATNIPDYLKCGICGNVVQLAMLLPWDREGRTACENCIRPALARNNFVCPLTGTENVSPDELIPNFGLRKAAENFVASVLDKIEEIEKEALRLAEDSTAKDNLSIHNQNLFQKETDHGTLEEKRMKRHLTQSKANEFGGGDDFGGDVFDVDPKAVEDDYNNEDHEIRHALEQYPNDDKPKLSSEMASNSATGEVGDDMHATPLFVNSCKIGTTQSAEALPRVPSNPENVSSSPQVQPIVASAVMEGHQTQRGPPAGYAIGPAAPTALNNPRMAHVAQPASSTLPHSIPPPPPGLPPSIMQQYPSRGRGFQTYQQRGVPRGRSGRYGAFDRGGSRFGGRGDASYAGGRSDCRRQEPEHSIPEKEVVATQREDPSAVSNGKRDRPHVAKEQEQIPTVKSPYDADKSKASKRSRDGEKDSSKAQSEPTTSHSQDRRFHAASREIQPISFSQTRGFLPHHVRGGRGVYRSPDAGPYLPGHGDRGRWSHIHMPPPQVAPSPHYQPLPPPYGLYLDAFGQRGRGREFRGGGRAFYRGGRF